MSQPNPDLSTTGPAIEDKSLDKESVIELLGEDDKEVPETLELETPPKEDNKDKQEKAEEADEESEESDEEKELTLEDELEEELEEPDEEKLELLEAPRRKEILAKYPDVFKDFPQLEKAMYRERAYSELLPTIEDARTAVEKSRILDDFEKDILEGSTVGFLTSVKNNDRDAFAKLIDNYLPNLYKADEHSYFHVIGNFTKQIIMSMSRDAKAKDDEDLSNAAAILNEYMFNTTQFTPPTKLSKSDVKDSESKQKEEEIARREKEFVDRQYTTARNDLGTRVDNILKSTVDKAIDPNESMTEYVKSKATADVLKGLEDQISRDTRFRAIYDKLWEKAFQSDFNKESMDRIKSAYLSKAKTLLPLLIKKARNEALKGIKRTSSNDDKDKRGPLPVGRTRSSTTLASGRANSGSKATNIPKGMTTLEFLNSD